MEGLTDYRDTADRPAEFPPRDGDWEGVPTTNESYGYNANDHSQKPPSYFIRLLAKASARGGNILLNIGPMGSGKIDPKDVAILQGIGAWWEVNGESIRGTTRTPLAVQAWGESTRKGNTLYLHVFQWPAGGKLVVGGLKTDVSRASLLADPAKPLEVIRDGPDVVLSLPEKAPDAADSVIAIECAGEPQADSVRLLSGAVTEDDLRAFDAKLVGNLKFGPGKKSDNWVLNWTAKDDAVVWPVRVKEKTNFEVSINYDAPHGIKGGNTVEGDAGKELAVHHEGTGGIYVVSIGKKEFVKTVRTGAQVTETLGRVVLEPGSYDIRVAAREIAGQELFRLRRLTLTPNLPTEGNTQ